MTTQYRSGQRSSGPFIAFLLAIALGAAAVVFFVRHAKSGLPAYLASLVTGRSTSFNSSVPTVVDRIQRLQRLESVVYSLDTVVEGARTSPVLPDLLGGDRILLVVHGQSVAGVDLSHLRPEDVRINGRSIHVSLPPSEIFFTTLDNQHTRVYARSTGLLVAADPNLETETRARAQDQLQKAALGDGILDNASKNARATITTILFALGFQQVDVT